MEQDKQTVGGGEIAPWIVPFPLQNKSAVNTVLRVAGTFHVLSETVEISLLSEKYL